VWHLQIRSAQKVSPLSPSPFIPTITTAVITTTTITTIISNFYILSMHWKLGESVL
jgi:predicted secreted protein